ETFGTNPIGVDTDNDGLKDSEEVWHQVYNACQPTGNWSGGWGVTINATTPFTVRVTSKPTINDSDGDGVSELAERQLAGQLDSQNHPYHPDALNSAPIAIYTDATKRFVLPGENLIYTTTVVANTAVNPGILEVIAPTQLGGAHPIYGLYFDPANFNGS